MDKLFCIGELHGIAQCYPSDHQIGRLANQLADTMIENEALKFALKTLKDAMVEHTNKESDNG